MTSAVARVDAIDFTVVNDQLFGVGVGLHLGFDGEGVGIEASHIAAVAGDIEFAVVGNDVARLTQFVVEGVGGLHDASAVEFPEHLGHVDDDVEVAVVGDDVVGGVAELDAVLSFEDVFGISFACGGVDEEQV